VTAPVDLILSIVWLAACALKAPINRPAATKPALIKELLFMGFSCVFFYLFINKSLHLHL
jgi:hypothetical protein